MATWLLFVGLASLGTALAQGGGGTLRVAFTTNPPSLDVMLTPTAATRQVTFYFLEPLVTFDEDYGIIPMLAAGWEISDDGTVYTFPLREGVLFHNGKEMTSADVKASLDRFIAVTPRRDAFANVVEVQASGTYEIKIVLGRPQPTLLADLVGPITYPAIMPQEIVEGRGVGEFDVEDYVGTGPYRLVAWEPDRHVHLERFAEYVPDTSRPMTGLGGHKIAHFDTIYLVPVSEASSRVAGLVTGEYDYAEALPPTQFESLRTDQGIDVHMMTMNAWPALEFNHAAEWTNNLQFRQAIQAALNMEEIMMGVTSGRSEFFRLNPSVFFTEQVWWNEGGAELYNQNDPEKARRLLAESGYAGQPIVMLTNRDFDYMYRTALTAAQQLEAVGINVDVQIYDWPGQRAVNATPVGWHINNSGYTPRFDPSAFSQSWHSLANRYGYGNPTMDQWFEAGAAAQDFTDRYGYFTRMQEAFYDDVTTIKIGDFFGLEATRSDLEGYRPWLTARFWNVERR